MSSSVAQSRPDQRPDQQQSRASRMRRRPIRGPIGLIIAGSGLAAEAYQHQREKSKAKGKEPVNSLDAYPESPPPDALDRRHSWDGAAGDQYPTYDPPPYSEGDRCIAPGPEKHNYERVQPERRSAPAADEDFDDESDSDADKEQDEVLWEMDEAARDVHPTQRVTRKAEIPHGLAHEPASIVKLVAAFLQQHPPAPSPDPASLTNPVIIPQKRPAARQRGFIRAYAPALESCGVSQDAFLHFLDFFDASLQYSNVIKAVFVGAGIVGTVPSLTTAIVSNALQAVAVAAGQTQSRARNNDFITRMNTDFFIPQGLICVIMKYKPNTVGDEPMPDLSSATNRAAHNKKFNIHSSHGAADDLDLGHPAELVFPDLGTENETANRFIRSMRFIRNYSDRRAHANFEMENPDSHLAATMHDRTHFESSWADPRNRSSGGRGGRQGNDEPKPPGWHKRRQLRHAHNRAAIARAFRGEDTQQGSSSAQGDMLGVPDQSGYMSRRRARSVGQTPITPEQQREIDRYSLMHKIRAARKPDVLYMMIVPMPSREELASSAAGPKQDIEIVDHVVS